MTSTSSIPEVGMEEATLDDVYLDPSAWSLYSSPEGYPYYYNHTTGLSVWAPYDDHDGKSRGGEEEEEDDDENSSNDLDSNVHKKHESMHKSNRKIHLQTTESLDDDEYDGAEEHETGRLVDDDRYQIREDLLREIDLQNGIDDAYIDDEEGSNYNVTSPYGRRVDGGGGGTDVDESAFLAYLNSPEGQAALEASFLLLIFKTTSIFPHTII